MKTKLLAALFSSAAALGAAPLSETTAVFARPDLGAPPISYLKAGVEPTAKADSLASTPAGWMAIDLAGPFQAYVNNGDLTKSLDVRSGASIYLEPRADAAVLTIAEKGDKIEITGLPHGKWTRISLDRKITGYLRIAPAPLPPIATTPAGGPADIGIASSPSPMPELAGIAGKPVPDANLADGGSSALPRMFQGKVVSTRRPFTPRRPYDFQLNDDSGVRFAYLDISRLLQTEQIDTYVDHVVMVYGTASNVPDAKGIVIQVESLQLK